jgi:rhamnosyltransferase
VAVSTVVKPINQLSVALCILIRNPGSSVCEVIDGIKNQSLRPGRILVLDSWSTDGSGEFFKEIGAQIHLVRKGEFDHGGTRRLGAESLQGVDVVIFLTQDAIPSDSMSFAELVRMFEDPRIGLVYGRQIPRKNATPIEAHARLFNYPSESVVKTLEDVRLLGIKATFSSNSFAAYRQTALSDVEGFPKSCIVSEDTYVAGKMLLNGWKVAYSSEAKVFHSHDYSFLNEFRRYFDIGVFHSREPWVIERFGPAEGEGMRFFLSELKFLWPSHLYLFPIVFLKTVAKYLGFRLGKIERVLPQWLTTRLTMHPWFFLNSQNSLNRDYP